MQRQEWDNYGMVSLDTENPNAHIKQIVKTQKDKTKKTKNDPVSTTEDDDKTRARVLQKKKMSSFSIPLFKGGKKKRQKKEADSSSSDSDEEVHTHGPIEKPKYYFNFD